MGFQGMILNLVKFFGNVAVYNNLFLSLQFKYNNWEEALNNGTTLDSNNIWGAPIVYQLKSILNINVFFASIEIYRNSFIQWNSYNGVIFIARRSQFNGAVLIHNTIKYFS